MAAQTQSIKGLTATEEKFDGTSLRVLIVHARWNIEVINPLVQGAIEELNLAGVKAHNIVIESVPGAYELPWACGRLIAASQTQASVHATDLMGTATSLLESVNLVPERPSTSTGKPAGSSQGSKRSFSAVIAIGTLIKGSTMHFEYICEAVSQGLMRVGLDTGVPVIFGVLTCLTEDQAKSRAGLLPGSQNHGRDWGKAAVEGACKAQRWAAGEL